MDKLKGSYSHYKHFSFRWDFNEIFLFCNFEIQEGNLHSISNTEL